MVSPAPTWSSSLTPRVRGEGLLISHPLEARLTRYHITNVILDLKSIPAWGIADFVRAHQESEQFGIRHYCVYMIMHFQYLTF